MRLINPETDSFLPFHVSYVGKKKKNEWEKAITPEDESKAIPSPFSKDLLNYKFGSSSERRNNRWERLGAREDQHIPYSKPRFIIFSGRKTTNDSSKARTRKAFKNKHVVHAQGPCRTFLGNQLSSHWFQNFCSHLTCSRGQRSL